MHPDDLSITLYSYCLTAAHGIASNQHLLECRKAMAALILHPMVLPSMACLPNLVRHHCMLHVKEQP